MASKLQELGDELRTENLKVNTYQKTEGRKYKSTHPNAISGEKGTDDPNDIKGKGTGTFLDSSNGGGDIDINGTGEIPNSGRVNNVKVNKYNSNNPYRHPDSNDVE